MTLLHAFPQRLLLACSTALVAASLLSACNASGNGLRREAATQLQARVLEVTQASSQNDPASALKALEGLEADLAAAQAKGQVSEERRRSITTVATAVRADLNEAIDAQQAAAKAAPSPTAEAPASQPAPAPAPPADQGNTSSNSGSANKNNGDKGKGTN